MFKLDTEVGKIRIKMLKGEKGDKGDIGYPTDAQVNTAVTAWLEAHISEIVGITCTDDGEGNITITEGSFISGEA